MPTKREFHIPDLMAAKRLLCIQPHYDDNDLYAGGIIASLHDKGAKIIYLTVTDDLVGCLDQSLTDAQLQSRLRDEQLQASRFIGVDQFIWLDYPDAGDYGIHQLRQDILQHIHQLSPDFVLTVDPWLPYEAHQDHIKTGYAAAEAVLLAGFSRLASKKGKEWEYDYASLKGAAFYNSARPNMTVNTSRTVDRKHQAIHCYQSQFTPEEFEGLDREIYQIERIAGGNNGFEYGESLKVVWPNELHGNVRTWRS